MLCARGCFQQVEDLDKLFASTPFLSISNILVVMNMAMGLPIFCFGITTTFLHAFLNPWESPIFVWPPEEFSTGKQILWAARRAVYGLRNAPRDWQDYFAPEMRQSGFRRLRSDGNISVHKELMVIVLAYVNNLMAFGKRTAPRQYLVSFKKASS